MSLFKRETILNLYLDTEFDGHGGPLISLAIAGDDGKTWYGIFNAHCGGKAGLPRSSHSCFTSRQYIGHPFGNCIMVPNNWQSATQS